MAKKDDTGSIKVTPRQKMGQTELQKAQAEAFHDSAVERAGDWLADDDEFDRDTMEIARGPDETTEEDEQEAIRKASRRRGDPSLSDAENELTEYERLFVIEYVRLEKGKAAALAAGYSPSCAASKASKLLKDPRILRCVAERRRRASRLVGLDGEFVVSALLEIYNRSMQNIPAFDREGNPTGYYSYDGATALRALEGISKLKGLMTETEREEKPVESAGIEVSEDVSGIALRLRGEADRIKAEREGK